MKKLLNTKLKDMKAITLIALVITIVILIILAGVLVSLTLGNNGLFSMAKKAKNDYESAAIDENTKINDLYSQIEVATGGTITINSDTLSNIIKQEINEKFKVKTIEYGNFTVAKDNKVAKSLTSDEGYKIISYMPSFDNSTYINVVYDEIDNNIYFRNFDSGDANLIGVKVTIIEMKIEE